MRHTLVLLITLISSSSFATPKDLAALMKESQAAREALAQEKDATKKIKKLKEFEASLNATIKSYEKESPDEGGEAEEKVVKFSYRFEPLFDLANAKITKETCEKAKGQITKDDQAAQPEGSPLSANAKEALTWVDLLCKN